MVRLQVTVEGGFNLPTECLGKYEMFVKVSAGYHDEKTRPVANDSNKAIWGDTLSVEAEHGRDLHFELKDREVFNDESLGEGELSAEHFQSCSWAGEIPLKHHGRSEGFLRVRVMNPEHPQMMGGMGGMGMHGGMGMAGMGMQGGMYPPMGMGGMGMQGGMHPPMGMGGMGMHPGMGMQPNMYPGGMYPPMGGMHPGMGRY